MGRSIHSLVPPRPTQGNPPSGRLDFPLVTRSRRGRQVPRSAYDPSRNHGRYTSGPGNVPMCRPPEASAAGEAPLTVYCTPIQGPQKEGAKSSRTRRNGDSGLTTCCCLVVRLFA